MITFRVLELLASFTCVFVRVVYQMNRPGATLRRTRFSVPIFCLFCFTFYPHGSELHILRGSPNRTLSVKHGFEKIEKCVRLEIQ